MDTGCPCKEGRFGAFGIVVSVYWVMQCGGIAATLNLVAAGNALGVWWAIWTACGVILLGEGIFKAREHDDATDYWSVAVSVGLIGLALWALAHHWFYLTSDCVGHASRVFWFGLLGSEAFNLWLNFRGRRHAATVPEIQEQARPSAAAGYLWRRLRTRQTRDWREEIYEDVQPVPEGGHYLHAPPSFSSPVVEHHDAPQIVYVRDERTGQFIPVQLPDAVPVGRRLPR